MKKIILLLILVISFSTIAQNTFSISSESVEVGDNFTLDIDLANSIEVTAFQFDLSHNENAYELTSGSALNTRAENHTLSVTTVDENTIRVLVYSTSNGVISAGNGTVLSLTFSSENEPNTYNLSISNIVLSDQNGESVSVNSTNGSVTLLGPRYDLTTSAVDFGEIPVDSSPSQSVTVSNSGNEDLVILSYATDAPFSIAQTLPVTITPGNSSSFTVEVDTSTKQVVESVLSFSTNDQDPLRAIQSTTIQADIFAVNEIYIGSGQGVSNSEITIPVTISNMEPFSAFQFDVTLPNDVIYSENSTVFSSRSQDHVITASIINTNTIRFVSYSGTNTNFTGNDGEVFSFKIIPNITSGTYNLPITDAIISNEDLVDITSDVYNGSFTINAPSLSTSVQVVDYGNIPITEVQTTNITLTNTGSAALIIDELVFDSSKLLFPLEIPTTLEVNESTSVALEFSPSQTGSFNENISIRNNSPEEQQIINVLANVFSPNYLSISDTNVFRENSYEIPLNLVNNENIRAVQYDLNIPEGFIFDLDNVVESSILNNFTTSISSLGNNNYRFLIYTVSNDFMNSGDETILLLPIFVENTIDLGQYTFEISNVVLSSESNNQNISSEALRVGYIDVIEDTTIPVITLTGDATVTIEVGSTYTDAGATAQDNYDGDITDDIVTVSTVDTEAVGTYTVTYDVSDANNNDAVQVIRTVNVEDTTIPVITLTGDATVTIEVGSTYTDAGATAQDNYDGDITDDIVTVSTVDTEAVGTYTVTYDVSDANNNDAVQVIRTVNVEDTTIPVITLTGDATVTIEVGSTYTDAGATAQDNYDGDITDDIVTVSTVDTEAVGTYTVTYDVSDANNNDAVQVIRTVNVEDTTIPVITLTGDATVTIEVGSTYTDAGATAQDNYDGDITDDIVTVSTVDTEAVGTYTVTYDVSDANNNDAVQVIRTVNVEDTTIPVITLTGDATVTIEVGSTYTDAGATAQDNYDGDITDDIVTVSTVDTEAVGTYTVTYDVSDANNNDAVQVIRTVNVEDTTIPVITLTGDATVTIEVGSTYTDAGATAQDNYDGDITDDIVTVSTVDTEAVGTYTVTYDVSDANNNDAVQVIRTVNVEDTTIPVITLTGDATVTIEVGSTYTDAGATAQDNYDGDITDDIVTVSTVDTEAVGTYTVTYDVSDANNNDAVQVIRTVNVEDTTIPVITLTGDATVTIEVGSTYTDAGATAQDNYDGDITDDIVTVSTVDTEAVGTYTVTYDVSDANNNDAVQVIRTVNVEDTTIPVITLTGDATVTIEVGSTYTDAGATAQDNYDGDITDDIVTVSTVDTEAVGTYTVTYDVSDANNNDAVQVIRTVNVEDTTIPVITLTGDATVTIEVGSTYTDAGATAQDNYDGDITDDIVTVSTVDTEAVGTYTVTYDVSDANNNDAVQVIRTVNVVSSLSNIQFEEINVNVFPNPSNGVITVKYHIPEQKGDMFAEVYDVLGRLVWNGFFERSNGVKEVQLNLNSLKKGNYFLRLNTRNNFGKTLLSIKSLIIK